MTSYAMAPPDPTAVMGRRIAAYIVDYLIGAAIALAVLVPMFNHKALQVPSTSETARAECNLTSGSSGTSVKTNPSRGTLCVTWGTKSYIVTNSDLSSLQGTAAGLFLGVLALNAVLLQGLTGATVGKLLFGLRAVQLDGSPAGIGRAALRTLLLVVIDAPCCWLIGLILALTTRGHRRLGDMAASTVVVRTAQVGHPVVVAGLSAPPTAAPPGWTGAAPPPAGGWTQPGVGEGWGATQGWGVAPPAAPTTDGPVWDEARHTYIQYDRNRSEWLQWSDERREWGPIEQA